MVKILGADSLHGASGYNGEYGSLPPSIVQEISKNDGTVPICRWQAQ